MSNHNFAANKMCYKVLNDIHLNIYLCTVRTAHTSQTHSEIQYYFTLLYDMSVVILWVAQMFFTSSIYHSLLYICITQNVVFLICEFSW